MLAPDLYLVLDSFCIRYMYDFSSKLWKTWNKSLEVYIILVLKPHKAQPNYSYIFILNTLLLQKYNFLHGEHSSNYYFKIYILHFDIN